MWLPLLALDNSVTIHEAGSVQQVARPVSLFRTFAQGEFSGTYPKPRISGATASVWQVDVKTTWPDGSIQQAFVSFRLDLAADGSAVVDFVADSNPCHLGNQATCEAAALTQQGMLDHNGGAWSATWYGSVNSIEYSAPARAMLAAGAWRWWMKGPVVTAVIAEDRSSAFLYDFGWQYSAGVWGAPTEAKYKSLHPVYELRFYPDPDGIGPLSTWPGVEVDAQVWNASMGRFQRFDSISLALKTGNGEATTAYSVSSRSFHARSRRHKLVWSGTAPGAVVVDYNFAYLQHTRIIPSYDLSLPVSSTLADSDISNQTSWLAGDEFQWCDTTAHHCASWQKGIGGTGARGDIAMIARWYLEYLYLMGHGTATVAKKKEVWDKLVIGNADAAAHAPIHYMETESGTFYAAAGSDTKIGRVLSLDARGWIPIYSNQEEAWINPKTLVCSASPCDGRLNASSNPYRGSWTADGETDYTTHAPSFYAIPYLLTGYHYYMAGAQMEAAFGLATTTAGVNSGTMVNARMHGRGIIYYPGAPRAIAWMHRNIFLGALISPDGTVEKAYFRNRLQNNAAFIEGVFLLTTGAHVPADPSCASFTRATSVETAATADMWCSGRDTWILASGGTAPTSNPAFVPIWTYPQSQTDGMVNGHRRTPAYMISYIANVWAWISRTGAILDKDSKPIFKHASDAMAAHYAGRVLSNPSSMYQFRAPNIGFGPGTKIMCETFEECHSSAITSWALAADMTANQTTLVVDGTDWQDTSALWFTTSWARIGDEYVRLSGNPQVNVPASGKTTITIAQRGVWGSVSATHSTGETVTWLPGFQDVWVAELQGGYPNIGRAALAQMADADKLGQYSPLAAYHAYSEALPGQRYQSNPQWAVVPAERVSNVQTSGNSGAVRLRWTAPSGEACRVYLGTASPPTSSDAGEALATASGRAQTYDAAGLQAGLYHYRISCHTARASGTVAVLN